MRRNDQSRIFSRLLRRIVGGGSAIAVLVGCGIAAETRGAIEPRPTMRLVFDEIKKLLPLSLDETRWSQPENRTEVLASLDQLERAATVLEHHGRAREVGFDELALGLGRDLREARNRYARGDYSEARFFLSGSLQNCVSCHVRLPTTERFKMADELIDQVEIQALDPRERAWLMVMVRRFDDALSVWESLMRDPTISPGQLDASGVLVDYLNAALRVRVEIERARATLALFAARPDLPVYLARRIANWRGALAHLDAKALALGQPPSIERGARLAREGGELAEGPYGRDGLIQDLAAASQLVQFLELERARLQSETRNQTPEERAALSRAYYWLAVVEARSLDGFWVNLAERHFEAAIRADPKGPFAERAYAQLEETQVLGFGGASSEHLPLDVWTTLRDLRELMKSE